VESENFPEGADQPTVSALEESTVSPMLSQDEALMESGELLGAVEYLEDQLVDLYTNLYLGPLGMNPAADDMADQMFLQEAIPTFDDHGNWVEPTTEADTLMDLTTNLNALGQLATDLTSMLSGVDTEDLTTDLQELQSAVVGLNDFLSGVDPNALSAEMSTLGSYIGQLDSLLDSNIDSNVGSALTTELQSAQSNLSTLESSFASANSYAADTSVGVELVSSATGAAYSYTNTNYYGA